MKSQEFDFCENVFFVIHSIRKLASKSTNHPDFNSKNNTKSDWGTSPNRKQKLKMVPKKQSKWASQIFSKSIKCRLQASICPSCCPTVSHSVPETPCGSSGCQMETPGIPNHSVGHHKITTIFCFRYKTCFNN